MGLQILSLKRTIWNSFKSIAPEEDENDIEDLLTPRDDASKPLSDTEPEDYAFHMAMSEFHGDDMSDGVAYL